jgi:hypothetical protein
LRVARFSVYVPPAAPLLRASVSAALFLFFSLFSCWF